MNNIENILILCIKDIKAGRSTLEDCLDQHSSIRRQLEPLLRIALSIQQPPPFKPTNDFRVRARVQLMNYIHDKRNENRSWKDVLNSYIRQSWYSGWLKTVAIVVAVILAFSALGTGTAYASKDSLPGDPLYSVKIGTEQVRRLLTVNDIARIELELAFADLRLKEIEALANQPVVLLLGEAVQPGGSMGHVGFDLVQLGEDAHLQNLLPEVPLIQRAVQHGLVQVLQLAERELRRQQFKADRLIPHLAP